MSRGTSFDELYTTLGALVQRATGRKWWRKGGVQAQQPGPYATIYLVQADVLETQVVEVVTLESANVEGQTLQQVPWNTSLVDCKVEFLRSKEGDTALQAATRLAGALRMEERFWDIWGIAGLVGGVQVMDISAMFRADIEPRAEVRFRFYANISSPLPLQDADIWDIDTQHVDVEHVRIHRAQNETDHVDVDVANE